MRIQKLFKAVKDSICGLAALSAVALSPYAARAQDIIEVEIPKADGADVSGPTSAGRNIIFPINRPGTTGHRIGVFTPEGRPFAVFVPTTHEEQLEGADVKNVAKGPGGAWGTRYDANDVIKLNLGSGRFKKFALPPNSGPFDLVQGSGGMFVTLKIANQIAKLNSRGQVKATYDIPTPNSGVSLIVRGGGAFRTSVFFLESNVNKVGAFNTVTETFNEYPLPAAWGKPKDIAVDPKTGNLLLVTENGYFGSMTPTGSFTAFPEPGGTRLTGVAVDPKGKVACTSHQGGTIYCATTNGEPLVSMQVPTDAPDLIGVAFFRGGKPQRGLSLERDQGQAAIFPVPKP
ncbi:MAG: hypothetical protein SFW62_07245 [Alphaproteobacteria bacterium]|nr:hypothetical protein [Alphaproteobacteria bacterium]